MPADVWRRQPAADADEHGTTDSRDHANADVQTDSDAVTGKVTNGDLTMHVFLGAQGGISKEKKKNNDLL